MGGGGWALVGLGPLGEFKKRNSIGWQLESPGLPFLPRAASATGSALLPTHPQLHRLAAAHASKRGLFAAPSGEHSATRTGSPRWPRNKKKRTTTIKETHKHAQPDTHTLATKHTGSMHWHCTEHLQEADAGRREGGGGIQAEGCSQPLVLPVLAMDVGVVAVWWPTRFALTDSSQGSQRCQSGCMYTTQT